MVSHLHAEKRRSDQKLTQKIFPTQQRGPRARAMPAHCQRRGHLPLEGTLPSLSVSSPSVVLAAAVTQSGQGTEGCSMKHPVVLHQQGQAAPRQWAELQYEPQAKCLLAKALGYKFISEEGTSPSCAVSGR